MSPMPAEFTDRWAERAEPAPGEGLVYWHMLVGGHPEVTALARQARQRLAPFSGLHLTPLRWLHMTVLIAGAGTDITGGQVQDMAAAAARLLAATPPATVTVGKILYHPEAIMLAAAPGEALLPVLEAARAATYEVTGTYGSQQAWQPHITVCYSTARQPAAPVISALGRELPGTAMRVSEVSLVIQRGPERDWDWHPVATVRFGT